MSEFTDFLIRYKDESMSVAQFVRGLGISPQLFQKWIAGAMPNEAALMRISEKYGIDYIYLFALAKKSGKEGIDKTRDEWRKMERRLRQERISRMRRLSGKTGSTREKIKG